jgi:molybdenum cofactor synthesis domain-containing protein
LTQSVTACLIIIGNEILSGRTQDTNLKHLALSLNELGVKLVHVRVIPDEESIIVETVNECRGSFDNVFTTGGIGPTHDDITADCIGLAFQKKLIINQEIKEIIERREAPPEVMETRMRMARIPEGATLIQNPTGGPHGFQVENVFVLAGVPMVMQAMLSTITKERLGGGEPTRSLTVGAYLSEGQIGKKLGMIQEKHPDIDLGSYPFYNEDGYGTNLVMRGTDMVALKAIFEEVHQMILSFGVEPIQE